MPRFNHQLMKEKRGELGLSLLDIVKRLYTKKLDMSEETLRSWEDGHTAPDAAKLMVLAEVLGCKIKEFYPNE